MEIIIILIGCIIGINDLFHGIKLINKPNEFAWFGINFTNFRSSTHANGLFRIFRGVFIAGGACLFAMWLMKAPEREKIAKIRKQKIEKQNDITFAPYYAFIKHTGTFKSLTKYIKPYRRGKILPLNGETNKVDNIYFQLPTELKPNDTSEVKTIVKLYRKNEVVASYTDKTTAYHQIVRLKLYDLTTHEVIVEETIYGKLPPNKKSHSGDDYGGDPDVLGYLKSLPVKNEN